MRLAFGLILLASALLSCRRHQDCELFKTCAGDLVDIAKEMASNAGAAAVAVCEECVRKSCLVDADLCSVDHECNFTARCQLQSTADEYQDCIKLLWDHGYTHGEEGRKPWEGSIHSAKADSNSLLDSEKPHLFGDCVHTHCETECGAARFRCDNSASEYKNLRILLAVRVYPKYGLAHGVQVRACYNDNENDCGPWAQTGEDGIRRFLQDSDKQDPSDDDPSTTYDLRGTIAPEHFYFEFEAYDDDLLSSDEARHKPPLSFPRTFYYPGRLGLTGLQLVSAYLFPTDVIEYGNAQLGRRDRVLSEAAQSVVLADSCLWAVNSLPNVQVVVEDFDIPQCAQQPSCSGSDCKACVWYAKNTLVSSKWTMSDGTGTGIIGLRTGLYTIRVQEKDKDAESGTHVIAQRTVRMVDGAMTVIRTWPLPYDTQVELSQP